MCPNFTTTSLWLWKLGRWLVAALLTTEATKFQHIFWNLQSTSCQRASAVQCSQQQVTTKSFLSSLFKGNKKLFAFSKLKIMSKRISRTITMVKWESVLTRFCPRLCEGNIIEHVNCHQLLVSLSSLLPLFRDSEAPTKNLLLKIFK